MLRRTSLTLFSRSYHQDASCMRTLDAKIVQPGAPGSVPVVHFATPSSKAFKQILSEGLKTRGRLADEEKMWRLSLWLDRNDVLFFWPFDVPVTLSDPLFINKVTDDHQRNWVAVSVDPRDTYVFNAVFRASNMLDEYLASRMRLADLYQTPQLQGQCWEVIVNLGELGPDWFVTHSRRFSDDLMLQARLPFAEDRPRVVYR